MAVINLGDRVTSISLRCLPGFMAYCHQMGNLAPYQWSSPCLALLQAGFTSEFGCPKLRWSLTPPFHPCLLIMSIGGLVSVALSIVIRRPGITRRPALRSPDFPHPFRRYHRHHLYKIYYNKVILCLG